MHVERAHTTLLKYLKYHKYFSLFRDSLNTAKWNTRPSRPIIWAKSGYLDNALALSGYAVSRNNPNSYYIFSLVINVYQKARNGFGNAKLFRNELVKILQEQ